VGPFCENWTALSGDKSSGSENRMTPFERFFDRHVAPFCIACGVVGFFIGMMMLGGR
jgi:hypothetical protein